MEEHVDRLVDYLIENIGVDNRTIKDLYKQNAKNLTRYAKEHSEEFDFLNNDEHNLRHKL